MTYYIWENALLGINTIPVSTLRESTVVEFRHHSLEDAGLIMCSGDCVAIDYIFSQISQPYFYKLGSATWEGSEHYSDPEQVLSFTASQFD